MTRSCARTLAALLLLTITLAAPGRAQRVWLQQGPGPNTVGQVEGITDREVVGAIKSVAVHPTNADVMFVGAVNGGIWRTSNATAASPTWVSQLGLDQSLNIGAIAYDPTDAANQTLMAGAGRFSSFSGRGHDRVGVWRTTNDGATWTLLDGGGTLTNINISGVAPRGATLVISSNTASPLGNRGVWRSINTGGVWTQISGGVGTGLPAGASHDLASDPSNNARLFTNSGTAGIYRSEDTGATWTKASDAAVDAALVGSTNVKISVGDANNVYVAIVAGGTQLLGLFRSGDGGGTWTALDLPVTTENGLAIGTHPGGQGTTHLSIQADLTNDNVVYVAGDRQPFQDEGTTGTCMPCWPNSISANDFSGRLFRVDASLAAGTQATHLTHTNTTGGSSPHADSRDMAIDANGNLVETDDGGIYRRTTPLLNAGDWFSVNGDIKVTELHDVAWDAVAKVAIGGAQDTGTPEQITAGNTRWRSVSTADGGDVGVNDFGVAGTTIRYSSNQRLSNFRRRTLDATNTVSATVFPALTVVGGGAALVRTFKTPIAVNQVDPTRLIIHGGNSVYESLDQGNTITEIGPGIAQNISNRDPIAYGATGNADILYIGSGDQVFVRNAAAPAALTASATYPGAATGRGVVDIVMDPAAPLIGYVADTTHVYRTPDGGATWADITGDLLTLTPGSIRSITFSTSNATGSVIVGTQNGVFMAVGPAFNVWTAVGTGLPRVPVSDVHYNAADEILVAGTLGRGAWTVSLEERDPVDIALVLDLSGSMLSPACGTCDPKLQVLKDAVELFVQLFTIFTIPADRFGLNYFRTNISEFLVSGSALFDAQANAAAVIADVQAQTTVPANLTAMGGGIQQAINRLTDATRPRNIILFTDGMQNVNPMVDATTFVIDNVASKPNSNVNPTMPPTDLNAALGIKVNTIGVGATPAFVDLLDDIAAQTNGLFKLTTAPDDDLRRFYIEDLIDVLRTFSPQLIAYRYAALPADTASQVFTTNVTARRVVFKLSWKRGSQFGLRVVKNGVDLTRYGRLISGAFYRIFSIDVPAMVSGQPVTPGGDWQVIVSGTKGTSYEVAGIVEEEVLKYEFTLGGPTHVAGSPLPLSLRLTFAGQPVTDARVSARVLAPRQSLATLLSTNPTPAAPAGFQYETGATAAQRKFQLLLGDSAFRSAMQPAPNAITFTNNGNGTYSASYANTSITGPYSVIFTVEGQRADIGTYSRTESRSVSVRFGTAVLATSSVSFVPAGRTPAGQRYELTLRPRDANGNYLGPDYGNAIAVTVDGTPLTTAPIDRLDGSYVFQLVTARPPSSTTVTITVMGRPLYNGPLSGIPSGGAGGQPTFALSAHVGAAIPATGFAASAKTGLLLEADLELRVTRSFSIEGVVGRYEFGSSTDITGGSLFAKGYLPGSPWRPHAAVGAGVFKPNAGSSGFGLSGTVGLNRPLTGQLEFDAGAGYTHVFRSDGLGFFGIKAGFKLAL
ncbi:MAG: VWA domain-containing protein [Gemmatimonadaceae bacterium]